MSDNESEITMADIAKMAVEISTTEGPGSEAWKMESSHTQNINDRVMEALRTNNGKIPGELEGLQALILTTTGAKTGQKRTVPLACLEIDGRLIIIASMGGAPRNPPWYYNLVKNPEVQIERDGETYTARAVVPKDEDRDHLFQTVCDNLPVFSTYEERAGARVIPVVELIRQ
jgi:deazaflavin-dependent oxidoreductase (nitroreductase family)